MIRFQIQRTKLPTGSAAGRRSQVDTAAFLAAVALMAQVLSACSSQSLPAARAFSSEVDAGSREENASKQETGAPFRFNRNGKGSSVAAQYPDLNDPTPKAGMRGDQVAQLKAELIQLRDNQERATLLKPPNAPPTKSPISDQSRAPSLVAVTSEDPIVAESSVGTAFMAPRPLPVRVNF